MLKIRHYANTLTEVAAYTVGGLVAGKVLAKVGFFALLLKFWKLIAVGLVAVGAGIKKFFFSKRDDAETVTEETVTEETVTEETVTEETAASETLPEAKDDNPTPSQAS